jgi:hypothetical protein
MPNNIPTLTFWKKKHIQRKIFAEVFDEHYDIRGT